MTLFFIHGWDPETKGQGPAFLCSAVVADASSDPRRVVAQPPSVPRYPSQAPRLSVRGNARKGRRERDSLIRGTISLIARFNSLLGGKKFPVRMRRELACKTLIRRLFLLPLTRRRAPDRMKFPVFSLLTGNFKKLRRVRSRLPPSSGESGAEPDFQRRIGLRHFGRPNRRATASLLLAV